MHHLQCLCLYVRVFWRSDQVPAACHPVIQSATLAASTRAHRVPTAKPTGRLLLDVQLGE